MADQLDQLPKSHTTVRRKLGSALVPGEQVLVAQHRHPIVLVEPVLTSILTLIGIGAISDYLGDLNLIRGILMVGWLVLVMRAVVRYVQWNVDWFVVTDRRLLRQHGILTSTRDMMPLAKVTDMAFERPIIGRIVGYGRFVLESAGKDQALREISYVRDPEQAYELICLQIFVRPPFSSDRTFSTDRTFPTDRTVSSERTSPGNPTFPVERHR